ncbi:hypothetical protein [Caldisericum sp.]|jgi:hypothetical protein|uniref:hypothetical protein n=1 Tax=Caldisericum sp. TaxID=2499687 RepID=UPI003D1468F7
MNSYIGYIYLAAAAALMLLSYFKDKNKTKKALMTTGKDSFECLACVVFYLHPNGCHTNICYKGVGS